MDEPPLPYSPAEAEAIRAQIARDMLIDPGPTHTPAELADDTAERYST